MTCPDGARFPNPCPVCGDKAEHASWRGTVTGSPATLCPHPAERGHGTGCCCAGLSSPLALLAGSPSSPFAAPGLEERVAALEAIIAKLAQSEPGFMSEARMDESRDNGTTAWVRITHLPTGVTVEAPTRGEAITKLGRAIERRARRHAEHPARDFPLILAAPIPVRDHPA